MANGTVVNKIIIGWPPKSEKKIPPIAWANITFRTSKLFFNYSWQRKFFNPLIPPLVLSSFKTPNAMAGNRHAK